MPRIAELLAKGLRDEGLEVTLLPWGGGGRSIGDRLLGRARQLREIRRVVRARRPEVLLVQTSHDWPCVVRDGALALAVRRGGCATVLQLHGSRDDRLAQPGSRAFKLATRRLLSLVDGVLVLSSDAARRFRAFDPGAWVGVVVNPFVPSRLPRRSGDGRGAPVVLFAGRLLAGKGIFDTIEAFARVRERMPAELVVAGDGPAAARVARMVRERGLVADVTLAGRLDPEQLRRAYAQADVFVLPTYLPEGFPTAISEAMSAGLPIVTTRARGSADLLVEGTNALFVPPRSPTELAEALERLLADEALRARMAAANRAKVEEFAPGRVAPAYLDVLAEIRP